MKVKVKEEIKTAIHEYYSSNPDVTNFLDIIKKLNEGKWVHKDEMLQAMISYVSFNERSINELAKLAATAQINYEVSKEVQKQYKEYFETVIAEVKEADGLIGQLV